MEKRQISANHHMCHVERDALVLSLPGDISTRPVRAELIAISSKSGEICSLFGEWGLEMVFDDNQSTDLHKHPHMFCRA